VLMLWSTWRYFKYPMVINMKNNLDLITGSCQSRQNGKKAGVSRLCMLQAAACTGAASDYPKKENDDLNPLRLMPIKVMAENDLAPLATIALNYLSAICYGLWLYKQARLTWS